MFNNEILSDVKFVVQASPDYRERNSKRGKMEIPAHKFLLSISSPVFFAMFCGEMAETKEHIDLPDCEYEGMLELLRYIYTDEVCLNGNNVMQVLYLAEKYMIPSLTSECAEYLRENLDPSNVLCVLKHAEQYGNEDLSFDCWLTIDKNTVETLKSDEFLSMDRSFLSELVERDKLTISEVELFKAIECWAKEECERQHLEANGPLHRQVLGEGIVKNIRFTVMKEKEFEDVVLPNNILTREETRNISEHFQSTLISPISGFLDVPRVGSLLRCCSFKSFLPNTSFAYNPNWCEWTPFEVDSDILIHGVSMFGNDGGKYTVELEIFTFDADDNKLLYATKTGTYTSGRKACNNGFYYGFDIIFDEPCVLVAYRWQYSIEALVSGPGRCLGKEKIYHVEHSGVKIVFDHHEIVTDPVHGELSRNAFAEILFTVQ